MTMTVSSYNCSDASDKGNASSSKSTGITATKDEEEMNLLRKKITKVEKLVHVPMTTKKEKENYDKKRTKYINQLGEIAVSTYTTTSTALSRKHNVNSEIKLLQKKAAKVDKLLLARTLTDKEMMKYVAKREKYISELGELVYQSLSAAVVVQHATSTTERRHKREVKHDRDDDEYDDAGSTERTADLEESFASLSSPPTTPSKTQKMKSKNKISSPPLVVESEMRSTSATSSPTKNKQNTRLQESSCNPSPSHRSSPAVIVPSTSSQEQKSLTGADDRTSQKVVKSWKDSKNAVAQKKNATKISSKANDDHLTTTRPSAVAQKPSAGGNAVPWPPKPVEPSLHDNDKIVVTLKTSNGDNAIPWPPKTVKSSLHNNSSKISVTSHSPKSPTSNNKNITPLSSSQKAGAGVEANSATVASSTTTTMIPPETSPWDYRRRVISSSNVSLWDKRSSAPPMLQQPAASSNSRTVCCRKGGGGKLAQRYLQHIQQKSQQDYHHQTAEAGQLASNTIRKWEASPPSSPPSSSRKCKHSNSTFYTKQTNTTTPAWTEYAAKSCYPYRFEHNHRDNVVRATTNTTTMSNGHDDSSDDESENRSIEAVNMEDEEIEEYIEEEVEIVVDHDYGEEDEDEVHYEEESVEDYEEDDFFEEHLLGEEEDNDGGSTYYEEVIVGQEDCDDNDDSDENTATTPFMNMYPDPKGLQQVRDDPITPNDKSKSSSIKMTKEELHSEIFTNLFRLAHKENILESPKSPNHIIGGRGSSPHAKYRK